MPVVSETLSLILLANLLVKCKRSSDRDRTSSVTDLGGFYSMKYYPRGLARSVSAACASLTPGTHVRPEFLS